MKFFNSSFMSSNSTGYRLARTIAQGVIGVLIANIDMLIEAVSIPNDWKPFIVAMTMAVLSPIMGALSGNNENDTEPESDYINTEYKGAE